MPSLIILKNKSFQILYSINIKNKMLANEVSVNTRTIRRPTTINNTNNRFNRNDVIELLKHKITTYINDYDLEDNFNFKTEFLLETINDIVETRKLKLKAQCINPLAFILGFVVLEKTSTKKKITYTINMEILNKILSNFKTLLSNERLEIEDIIRYARYWIVFIFKANII